jgi:hypothetical protein
VSDGRRRTRPATVATAPLDFHESIGRLLDAFAVIVRAENSSMPPTWAFSRVIGLCNAGALHAQCGRVGIGARFKEFAAAGP